MLVLTTGAYGEPLNHIKSSCYVLIVLVITYIGHLHLKERKGGRAKFRFTCTYRTK